MNFERKKIFLKLFPPAGPLWGGVTPTPCQHLFNTTLFSVPKLKPGKCFEGRRRFGEDAEIEKHKNPKCHEEANDYELKDMTKVKIEVKNNQITEDDDKHYFEVDLDLDVNSGLLEVFLRVYEEEHEVAEQQSVSDLDLREVSEVKLEESKEHIDDDEHYVEVDLD